MRRAGPPKRAPLALGVAVSLWASVGQGWYFPEHVELTRLALRDFAPSFASDQLNVALADARELGLQVCAEAKMDLRAVPHSWDRVACVPYGALVAIAGDHANDVQELESELSTPVRRLWPGPAVPLALLLTEASQRTWVNFQNNAPAEVLQIWTMDVSRLPGALQQLPTAVTPRDYVRTLDAELLAIDPGYVSRAGGAKTHYHDPTSDLDVTLAEAAAGDLDNALAQLMAHHIRSLQLAALSAKTRDRAIQKSLRVQALLEHAFALHFMEDGLAAGHIATDPAVTVDERRTQRHDFFNRQGLAVTRAATGRRCSELEAGANDMGLFPCWLAHGDGFATATDRLYVGEAAARLQTALALALRGGVDEHWVEAESRRPACRAWLEGGGEPGVACDLAWTAFLLDPQPEWARRACDEDSVTSSRAGRRKGARAEPKSNRQWASDIVLDFSKHVAKLARRRVPEPADAGRAAPQLGKLDPASLGQPLGPHGRCELFDAKSSAAILWRPVLMAWPQAQTDVTTLDGADAFGRGWDLQVLASAAVSCSEPFQRSAAVVGWSAVGTGVAYSTRNVFPHRKTRALVELNAGVAVGLLTVGDGPRFRTLGVLELRAPVTSLALYGAALGLGSRYPLAVLGDGFTVGVLGGRGYFALDDRGLRFYGYDVELIDYVLGSSGQVTAAARSGFLDNELRLRLGLRARDPDVALDSWSGGGWVVAAELNSGFFSSVFR